MTAHDYWAFQVALSVQIRQLRRDDLPKLEWEGQFSHFRQVFRRAYQAQQDGVKVLLVADCRNHPVGRLFINLRSANPALADGYERGYLYSFWVLSVFRRQGVGSRLMDAGEHLLRIKGYQQATIAVGKENFGALDLYQRRGYRIFGDDDGAWEYRDQWGRIREVREPSWLLVKNITE